MKSVGYVVRNALPIQQILHGGTTTRPDRMRIVRSDSYLYPRAHARKHVVIYMEHRERGCVSRTVS